MSEKMTAEEAAWQARDTAETKSGDFYGYHDIADFLRELRALGFDVTPMVPDGTGAALRELIAFAADACDGSEESAPTVALVGWLRAIAAAKGTP